MRNLLGTFFGPISLSARTFRNLLTLCDIFDCTDRFSGTPCFLFFLRPLEHTLAIYYKYPFNGIVNAAFVCGFNQFFPTRVSFPPHCAHSQCTMCIAHGLRKVSGLLRIVLESDICWPDQSDPQYILPVSKTVSGSIFFSLSLILASLPRLPLFLPPTSSSQMPLHNLMLRRKKVGKVFPVKISTMDAELEFSLDYKVIWPIIDFLFGDDQYFSRQLDRNSSTLSVGQSGSEKPGKHDTSCYWIDRGVGGTYNTK